MTQPLACSISHVTNWPPALGRDDDHAQLRQPCDLLTAQFVDEMDAVSRGLIAMGLQAEEKVALITTTTDASGTSWTTPSCKRAPSTFRSPQ